MDGLDHGILNVPLSKRGDIDKQIDAFKAQQKRELDAHIRAANKAHTTAKDEAFDLIDRLTDEHIARIAAKSKIQKRSVRKQLRSMASMRPEFVAKALREGGAA